MSLTANDVQYFTTMAGIAATLLGLSFLALTFYLEGVYDRYQLMLPVFRHEDRFRRRGGVIGWLFRLLRTREHAQFTHLSLLEFANDRDTGPEDAPRLQRNPFDLTDLQLFDGDPLIVFLAFSTSLSWNLYFLALTVSLTLVGWGVEPSWPLATELTFFLALMVYSNATRRAQYDRLRTYRTRDERLTPVLEWVAVTAYGIITLFAWAVSLVESCPPGTSQRAGLCSQMLSFSSPHQYLALELTVLKVICLLAFSAGLYVTNHDLFVFFKAKMSDEMRGKWLAEFASAYADLQNRVLAGIAAPGSNPNSTWPEDKQELKALWNGGSLWNEGRPQDSYFVIKSQIRKKDTPKKETPNYGIPTEERWTQIIHPDKWIALASWMVDVPAIAAWKYDLEQCLDYLLKQEEKSATTEPPQSEVAKQ